MILLRAVAPASSYDDYDQLGLKNITVFEDVEIHPSSVLNMFGDPYVKYFPKQPIGFDLTRKNKNDQQTHGQARITLQES